uniref:ARAD1D48312p n=1 Tax=Blastobotrys adeninivorans TaxID=409370 RepID=A0A060TJN5_BLAAD
MDTHSQTTPHTPRRLRVNTSLSAVTSSPISASSATSAVSSVTSPIDLSSAVKICKDHVDVSDGVLGRGAFCTVYRGIINGSPELAGRVVAVKMGIKSNLCTVREASLLTNLDRMRGRDGDGDNVVEFYGMLADGSLALRYYPHTVHSFVLPLRQEDVWELVVGKDLWLKWAHQLSGALRFLERANVVHGDIQSVNIFVDEDANVFLGDFSSAHYNDDLLATSHEPEVDYDFWNARNIQYSAPELLKTTNCIPSFRSDVFSTGLVLLFAGTGTDPYHTAKNGAQRLIWAQRGMVLECASDEDRIRISSVQSIVDSFIRHRTPLSSLTSNISSH